jgi:putative ABC transport system permease protein
MSVLRSHSQKENLDRDLEEELQATLDLRVRELMNDGQGLEQARRQARLEFGGVEQVKEAVRDERHGAVLDKLVQDVRYGLRMIRRTPGFAIIVVLTLGGGIAGVATMFSVVDAVLLRPLPFADADGLVTVGSGGARHITARDFMSPPDLADLVSQSPSLETLVGYDVRSVAVTEFGEPTLLQFALVTEGLLTTFRLAPALGRDLRPEEAVPGAPLVAVISYGFWREQFGMAEDILERTITLGDTVIEIVGVAPEGFGFPSQTRVWIPRRTNPETCGRACHVFLTVGRLASGATVAMAQSEAEAVAMNLAKAHPGSNARKIFGVESLQDRIVGDVRPGLWLLFAAVTAVLLIACANVANLMLARAATRRGEIALRSALGADRKRLAAQVIVECCLLTLIGAAVGLLLAQWGIAFIRHASADIIPRVADVALNWSVMLFTLGLVGAVTLLVGMSPLAFVTRVSIRESLISAGQGSSANRLGRRSRDLLVAFEVALSVVLLIGASLLLRSLGELHRLDLGFETRAVTRFTLALPDDDLESVRMFYRSLEERIERLPGVESVGSVYGAPLGDGHTTAVVAVDGRPEPKPGEETYAGIRAVSPGYLATVRIPLLRGRTLTPSDDVGPVPVAVVNQAFVQENFPNEDPMGRRVRIKTDQGFGSPYWMIVGVVADIRSESLRRAPVPEIYVPHGHFGPGFMTVTVRGTPGSPPTIAAIRSEVHALDPTLPLRNVHSVEEAIAREVAPSRFYMFVMGVFAVLALGLAVVGLYGVVGFLVSQRTQEIGVRVALGATREKIIRLTMLDGLRPAMIGMLLGFGVSLGGGRILRALLFGVTPSDPVTFASVPVVVLLAAMVATFLPAARASHVDPVVALRRE